LGPVGPFCAFDAVALEPDPSEAANAPPTIANTKASTAITAGGLGRTCFRIIENIFFSLK
jgi:hypothetical protein